jgi:hypothetical protein
MSEYEIEPVPGLPEPLPKGESLLWQAAPGWSALARHSFYLREVAVYFAVLLTWYLASTLAGGTPLAAVLPALGQLTLLAGATLGLIALYALLLSRTTMFTVTSRRIVIRSGIALPTVVNIPFRTIQAAGLKSFADRSGNIALTLQPDEHIAYLVLWPNVRPWRLSRVEPVLRGIADAAPAAQILARALAAAAEVAPQRMPAMEWETGAAGQKVRAETAVA